jgi:hypothetical protein
LGLGEPGGENEEEPRHCRGETVKEIRSRITAEADNGCAESDGRKSTWNS